MDKLTRLGRQNEGYAASRKAYAEDWRSRAADKRADGNKRGAAILEGKASAAERRAEQALETVRVARERAGR